MHYRYTRQLRGLIGEFELLGKRRKVLTFQKSLEGLCEICYQLARSFFHPIYWTYAPLIGKKFTWLMSPRERERRCDGSRQSLNYFDNISVVRKIYDRRVFFFFFFGHCCSFANSLWPTARLRGAMITELLHQVRHVSHFTQSVFGILRDDCQQRYLFPFSPNRSVTDKLLIYSFIHTAFTLCRPCQKLENRNEYDIGSNKISRLVEGRTCNNGRLYATSESSKSRVINCLKGQKCLQRTNTLDLSSA